MRSSSSRSGGLRLERLEDRQVLSGLQLGAILPTAPEPSVAIVGTTDVPAIQAASSAEKAPPESAQIELQADLTLSSQQTFADASAMDVSVAGTVEVLADTIEVTLQADLSLTESQQLEVAPGVNVSIVQNVIVSNQAEDSLPLPEITDFVHVDTEISAEALDSIVVPGVVQERESVESPETAIEELARVIETVSPGVMEHLQSQLDRLATHIEDHSGNAGLVNIVSNLLDKLDDSTVHGPKATDANRLDKTVAKDLRKLDEPPGQAKKYETAKQPTVSGANKTQKHDAPLGQAKKQTVTTVVVRIVAEKTGPVQTEGTVDSATASLRRAAPGAKATLARSTSTKHQIGEPPSDADVQFIFAASTNAKGAGTSGKHVQGLAVDEVMFEAGGVISPATTRELGLIGIRAPHWGDQFDVDIIASTGPLVSAAAERFDLQGSDLAAGTASIHTAALEAALQQFLESAEEVARNLGQAFASGGVLSWLMAAIAAAGSIEFCRRKKRKLPLTFASPSLSADSTFSWMPGMPGSYSDDDA